VVVSMLRGLFKREPKGCEVCGNIDDRTHLLDETWRGRFPGEKRRLCLKCLKQLTQSKFQSFRGRCLLLEPVAKSNAFYGYTASKEDLRLIDNSPEGAKEAIMTLLDRVSGRCRQCEEEVASFLWVPAAAFKAKWWELRVAQLLDHPEDAFPPLCGLCAHRRVFSALEELQTRLDEMQPPVDETILMFSGES